MGHFRRRCEQSAAHWAVASHGIPGLDVQDEENFHEAPAREFANTFRL